MSSNYLSWQEEDYYSLLGITRMANDEQIRKAYRLKAKECHPDRFPMGSIKRIEADLDFKELTQARDTLLDPIKRQAYDNELQLVQQAHFDQVIYEPPPPPPQPKEKFNKVSSFLDNLKQAYDDVHHEDYYQKVDYSLGNSIEDNLYREPVNPHIEDPPTRKGAIPEYSKRNAATVYYAQGMRYAARGQYRRALYAFNNAKMLDPSCTLPENIMRKIKMQAFFK